MIIAARTLLRDYEPSDGTFCSTRQYITRTRPQHYCYNNSYSPDIPTIYNNISHVTFLLFAYVDNYWFMLLLYFLSNNTHIGPDAQRLRQGTGQTDLEVMFDNKVVANFSYCY